MSNMNFSIEEELPVILLKQYELNSHIKSYHAYVLKWNPTLGEFLKARLEPENDLTNLQLQSKNAILGLDIYQKGKLVDSQKLFHFFFVEAMKTPTKLKLMGKE